MTRNEAVAFIQFELGNRSDLFDAIVARLQQAQRLLERGRSLPHFLKAEDQTLALPAGGSEIAFPSGFLREADGEGFRYVHEGAPFFLRKLSVEEGVRLFTGEDAGRPRAYAIRASTFKFWPERDVAYNLTWSYYRASKSLATDVPDNEWLVHAPDVLIGAAGMSIAGVLGHQRAFEKFQALYADAWKGAFAHSILREEDNDPVVMGARV